jgi:hypothetical protein
MHTPKQKHLKRWLKITGQRRFLSKPRVQSASQQLSVS